MLTLIWIFLTANILCVSGTSLVHVPCDDKTVEKLSRLAVTYINEDRQTGYKFALNRITNIQAHQQVGKQCCHFQQWKGIDLLILFINCFYRFKARLYMYFSSLQESVYFIGPLSFAVGSSWKGLLS